MDCSFWMERSVAKQRKWQIDRAEHGWRLRECGRSLGEVYEVCGGEGEASGRSGKACKNTGEA